MTRILCFSLSQLDEEGCHNLYRRASQSRRAKADTYRHREDQLRCLAGEALLRFCLGTSDFTLETNAYGKPYVKERPDVHFNLSHSGAWVVLALSDGEVGIDVERIREDAKIEKLARRHFTQAEQDFVLLGDPVRQAERFFQIWTAKESYLKYLGTGLSKSLQSFDVLSMDDPQFFTRMLDDYCLTLCSQSPEYTLKILRLEQLV